MQEVAIELQAIGGDVGIAIAAPLVIALVGIGAAEALRLAKKIIGVRKGRDPQDY